MPSIGALDVSPLCLGANVFGWTADEAQSFALLDAFYEAGGTFIDTADAYPPRLANVAYGRSEEIIGAWMASRGNRDDIVIATKVGHREDLHGLAPETIRAGAEGSLRRLGTDRIDLYYAHFDDLETPVDVALGAFDELVRAGKVRELGASNFTPQRLRDALAAADRDGLARYAALQPHYNLMARAEYEGELRDVCAAAGIGCCPHSALASGFLSGKYRSGRDVESVRADWVAGYRDERGDRVLAAVDAVAAKHEAPFAAVALAWLAAQPTVVAPIASARTTEQLADLLAMTQLRLDADDLGAIAAASTS